MVHNLSSAQIFFFSKITPPYQPGAFCMHIAHFLRLKLLANFSAVVSLKVLCFNKKNQDFYWVKAVGNKRFLVAGIRIEPLLSMSENNRMAQSGLFVLEIFFLLFKHLTPLPNLPLKSPFIFPPTVSPLSLSHTPHPFTLSLSHTLTPSHPSPSLTPSHLSPTPSPLHTSPSPKPSPLHTSPSPKPSFLHTSPSPTPSSLHTSHPPTPSPLSHPHCIVSKELRACPAWAQE